MKPKPPMIPRPQFATLRQAIQDVLGRDPLSAREISTLVGVGEKEVLTHLDHIRQSLHRQGGRLEVTSAVCRQCDFVFRKRQRLSSPSRCPVCRSETIDAPRFSLGHERPKSGFS